MFQMVHNAALDGLSAPPELGTGPLRVRQFIVSSDCSSIEGSDGE